MFTRITQSLQKRNKKKIFYLLIIFSLLSAYPIYKNFYNGRAVTTYERHRALIEGRSEYYNPWQYRMLCPIVIEGMLWVYNHTIDKIYPIEEKNKFTISPTSEPTPETKEFVQLMQTKGALKYMIVFLLFRFILNFLVFLLAWYFWHYFVKNSWLVLFGLMFISLAMGNGVMASDLTFNTYLDNVFYLTAGCIIVYKKSRFWLIPLTFFAALNRETAILIPALYFISLTDFRDFNWKKVNLKNIKYPKLPDWVFTGILYAIFMAVFISLRLYYGYKPQQVWKAEAGLPMIKLNLLSPVAVKSYFEMLGMLSVIPFIIIARFRQFPDILKKWFLLLVPVWFAVHIYSVVIYQTRLFLVPLILLFVPMFLYLIENRNKKINL